MGSQDADVGPDNHRVRHYKPKKCDSTLDYTFWIWSADTITKIECVFKNDEKLVTFYGYDKKNQKWIKHGWNQNNYSLKLPCRRKYKDCKWFPAVGLYPGAVIQLLSHVEDFE